MSTWIIGDVHGHYGALERLVAQMDYRSSDELWFIGDLVNGCGRSADVLRWAQDQEAGVVLGNHDLHMLAVWHGGRKFRGKDDFDDVLDAPDAEQMIGWLQGQRILHFHEEHDAVLVHAGLHPKWTVEQAVELGSEVEDVLRGSEAASFFDQMYGNKPRRWDDQLTGLKRLRVIVNACTRMRTLKQNGKLDFNFSGEYEDIPREQCAWFEHPQRRSSDVLVVFGHWSALGYKAWSNAICTDSGARWGRHLTALRLEDRKVVQVSA